MKAVLCYPLLFLRGPLLTIARLLGGLCSVGGVIIATMAASSEGADKIPWTFPAGILTAAFVLFVLSQLYDQRLLKLSPHNPT